MTDRVAIFGSQPTKVRRLSDGSDVPVVGLVGSVSEGVTAGDGAALEIGSLPQALAYDGSGRLSTITVTQGADSYRQTLTYDVAGKLTGVSAWVKL